MLFATPDVQNGCSSIIYMLKLGMSACTLQCQEEHNVFPAAGVIHE